MGVTQKGEGSPVLLLHGYLSCKESFYYQINALAENGFKAVAPDLPYFGSSEGDGRAWAVDDYASWLKEFIIANRLNGADALAHSFGARVLFKLLSTEGNLLNKVIITGGAGLVKERSPQYMRQIKRYRRVKKIFPRYAERRFGSREYRTLSPVMRESYKKIVNEDLRDCASKITNPTLLIYGKGDAVTPPLEEGEAFRSLIKGSRLEIMDGGHFCFCEHYNDFNRLMLGFLDGG